MGATRPLDTSRAETRATLGRPHSSREKRIGWRWFFTHGMRKAPPGYRLQVGKGVFTGAIERAA